MNLINKKLNLIPLSKQIVPVKITDKMLNKIKYLCKTIPAYEWSGVLFYSIEGSIKDINNFKITLEDIYPMHKGTQGYTEYTFDETIVTYRMANPETLSMNMGHIHSHNTMATFFSGTDSDELTENAVHHNYYLSVIVNNYLDFTIRIGMLAKAESTIYTVKDEEGNSYSVSKPTNDEIVLYYNAEIQREIECITVDDSFAVRVKEVIETSNRRATEMQEKMKMMNQDQFYGNGKNNNANNKSLVVYDRSKKDKSKPKFDFPKNKQFVLDDYQMAIESFLVGLLGKNHKISTINRDLNSVLNVLVLNIKNEDFSNYVAGTITDYAEVYEEYFIKSPNIEVEFAEDLESVIDMLADSHYAHTPLVKLLISSLQSFKNQYYLALYQ
jgi:hypothetical protein